MVRRDETIGGMDAFTTPPAPLNEPNLTYAPGTPERAALELELKRQEDQQVDLTATIGGTKKMGGGAEIPVVQPHDHGHVLGVMKNATQADARAAVKAAQDAAPGWAAMSFDDRAAILLKAADLLAGPWRQRLNAATMLGQSKTAFQAEIDSACELIDFWRFNVHYARQMLAEAGMPPGVVNMLPGDGLAVSDVALKSPDLAGIHFTGSTKTFQHLWSTVGENISKYRAYPRIVGETGGKDFIVAHSSADPDVLRTAMIRGAFEFQGQKCSAASRAYVARSVWNKMRDDLISEVEAITVGDVTDFSNFMGAVIDERAFDKHKKAISRAKRSKTLDVLAGGKLDDSVGYFVRPTIVEGGDPTDQMFTTEYFGPILAVHVFDDGDYERVVREMESIAPYALTGAVIAQDRQAIAWTTEALRFAAGNFYINDKPTGAVVGQQPFGGGRASGTNDKAGAPSNLMRWTSPRSIKETFDPPKDYRYPFMD